MRCLGLQESPFCKTENFNFVELVFSGRAKLYMFRFFRTLAITEAMQFTVFTLFCVKSTLIEKVHEKSVEKFGLRRVVRGLQVMGLNLS